MKPFTTLHAIAAPLAIANIDTDQIIPKQFLTTVAREGLSAGLFYDMRFDATGAEREDFVLNQAPYKGAQVLITGQNFGCGSSREHAPWALLDFGISCVIASSFADIFYDNCFNNGVLPAIVEEADARALMGEARGGNHRFTVDLATQTITAPSGARVSFSIDPGRKDKLLRGLDSIGLTLQRDAEIIAFEARRPAWRR